MKGKYSIHRCPLIRIKACETAICPNANDPDFLRERIWLQQNSTLLNNGLNLRIYFLATNDYCIIGVWIAILNHVLIGSFVSKACPHRSNKQKLFLRHKGNE